LKLVKHLSAAAATLAASAALTGAAHASAPPATIFDNFGPSYASQCCIGYFVTSAGSDNGPSSFAMPFTASGAYDVTQIDLGLSNYSGAGDADISLWTDAGGSLGVQLGSWHVVATTPFYDEPAVVTISGITGVHLNAGHYYLEADASPGNTWDVWNWNTVSSGGLILSSSYGAISGPPLGAFDVLGTSAVPEPAAWTVMLLGFGVLGLALRARRRAAAAA
jgi:hypothetical protein